MILPILVSRLFLGSWRDWPSGANTLCATFPRETFSILQTLPAKLAALCEVEGLRIFALDLSFNRIQCNSWEELEPVLDQLLGQRIVHLLELGNNYLPALDSLKQSARLSEKFYGFGNRLSMLGYESGPFTDDPDLKHWLSNARNFKHEVYGITYSD